MDINYLRNNLLDKLPHGSGINGEWIINYNPNTKKWYAHNCYSAMDENGYYCHYYDFTAIYRYNGVDAHIPCEICNQTGYRQINEMKKFGWGEVEFINSMVGMLSDIYRLDKVGYPHNTGLSFVCNVCNGEGHTYAPEWELIRINFHDQREYNCCGYDLKNYLFDTCAIGYR